MKEEYDFTNAEQGRFYRPDAQFDVPIYLDPEVYRFVESIATMRDVEVSTIVNELLASDQAIAKTAASRSL